MNFLAWLLWQSLFQQSCINNLFHNQIYLFHGILCLFYTLQNTCGIILNLNLFSCVCIAVDLGVKAVHIIFCEIVFSEALLEHGWPNGVEVKLK